MIVVVVVVIVVAAATADIFERYMYLIAAVFSGIRYELCVVGTWHCLLISY